jgi:hypothetical protein
MSAAASNSAAQRSAYRRVEEALERTGSVRSISGDWQCPAHDDRTPSLSMTCKDDRVLIHCHKGCTTESIVTALRLEMSDLFDNSLDAVEPPAGTRPRSSGPKRPVASYEYVDRHGEASSTKTRYEPVPNPDHEKTFSWDQGNPKVLYRLSEIVEADVVWVNEGEKAADRMAADLPAGHVATCAPTTKWDQSFTDCLRGQRVHVIVDRDSSGLTQARAAYGSLRAAGIEVDLLHPAVTDEKADGFDHFEAGFGIDNFEAVRELELVEEEPVEIADNLRKWPYFLGGEANGSSEHAFAIDDLIHESSVAMIVGRQGSLKTPLIMDMAAHVGLGIPYQGLQTTEGCTIYIAAEGSGAIEKRIAGIYVEHPDLSPDAIVAITQSVNLISRTEADVFGDFLVSDIVPQLSMPVRMIIFDTMAKSTPGESDSDDKTISALEASARVIANRVGETNGDSFVPAAIVIHHPRKNDDVYRGSGAIEGNFDTIIHIEKNDSEKLEDRLYEVSLDKIKDGSTERKWAYRAELVHVGTSPSGKENYAPVVRYIDDTEAATLRVESKTKGRHLTKSVKHLIELILRVVTRDGNQEVPRDVLAKSGYLAHINDQGWDANVAVHGISLSLLQDMVYDEDLEVGRSEDGQRTIPDKCRKRWERGRNSLKNSGAAWICEGWVWLVEEDANNGNGR